MSKEKLYMLTAYTENQIGLLTSVAGMFTRRSINIEKLLVYPSRVEGLHKFKIMARTSEDKIKNIVLNLQKKVEVVKAFYYEEEERTEHEIETVTKFLEEHKSN